MHHGTSALHGLSKLKKVYKYKISGHAVHRIVTDEQWLQNCYLVTNEISGEQIIIDPGNDFGLIRDTIESNGNKKIVKMILTHAHFDHIGAVNRLNNHFSLPCLVHFKDERLLKQAPNYAISFGKKNIEPVKQIGIIKNVSGFTIDGWDFSILETPGHTEGSICIKFKDFIFTGDTLMKKHIGRADLPGSNDDELCVSIEYLFKQIENDNMIVFPGHGSHWTIGEARKWWDETVGKAKPHSSFDDFKNG
jgi:glyoxylase-like metal-dependent hydrolase (beta-lactamase superfamily II)